MLSLAKFLPAALLGLLLALTPAGCGNGSSGADGNTSGGGDNGPGEPGSISQTAITVDGASNHLVLQACGVNPTGQDLQAGSYTVRLDASTLSKGHVATTDDSLVKSTDSYVLVNLPIPAGAGDQSRRFFMLNGVGSSSSFSLPSSGRLQVMFVDSDQDANNGEASVSIQPGGVLRVDAVQNVLRWKQGCNSRPAEQYLDAGSYRFTLASSSLSSGGGSRDDYVILRTPSEDPSDDRRYVVINGVNGSVDVSFQTSGTLRAWALAVQNAPGGTAVVNIDRR
jgi:hypothetical protein